MKLSKSKLALAKVINENGGWPQDSAWAVQNGDHGRIGFSVNKPVRNDSKSWVAEGGFNFKIEVCNPLKNWHRNVLSREEYYQAYPKADADGWIEWKGGECPVGDFDEVHVKYKVDDGSGMEGCEAQELHWHHEDADFDIVAYRLHKPEVKPEFCESVTQGIPGSESIDGLCAKVTEENKHQHVDAKPTIEQLARDYRNKLEEANRKQQEADDAKVAADAALGELERAGEALGLLIGISKPEPEPELVITDWRDLQVGDEIECVGYGHPHTIGVVERFDEISVDQNIFVRHQNGDVSWPRLWSFIRRP